MVSQVINGKEYLFVEVPEWAIYFKVSSTGALYCSEGVLKRYTAIPVDLGYREVIGKASELTEEQCWMLASTSPEKLMDYIGMKPETTLILQKL